MVSGPSSQAGRAHSGHAAEGTVSFRGAVGVWAQVSVAFFI